MARLYEGMELPVFRKIHEDRQGKMALLVLSDSDNPDIRDLPGRFRKILRPLDISLRILTDRPEYADASEILTDPERQMISEMLDEKHCGAFFLMDEKGKILLADYPDDIAELYDSERIRNEVNETVHFDISEELLADILDAYPYEIVYADRNHVVRYMNATARKRYGDRVRIGNSLFNCHNERSREKILAFLRRADEGENEMFETYNQKTGEREFFVPVRNGEGKVIGYFERHEAPWNRENADVVPGNYWMHRNE